MYDISLQQIEYFITVAERKNITEAAKVLFVTQPAVSKWIRHLETQLDMALFERTTKGVTLTEKGQILYREWKPLLGQIYDSIENAHSVDGRKVTDELNIGSLNGFNFDYILPGLLKKYSERYPDVEVNVTFDNFRELREGLMEGQLDVIVTPSFDLDSLQGVSQKVIDDLRQYIAISADHPLAQRGSLDLVDLRDEVFYVISPDETETGGARVLRACQRKGFTPRKVRYAPSVPSMIMAVKQGLGVTICSDISCKDSGDLIKLYDTPDLPVDEFITIAWRANNTKSSAMRFVEMGHRTDKHEKSPLPEANGSGK